MVTVGGDHGEKIKVSVLAIKHLPNADLMVLRFCFLLMV
jgi:hypothetical protein